LLQYPHQTNETLSLPFLPFARMFQFRLARRCVLVLLIALSAASISGCSERKKMLSIGSGGTGGVYFPLGGGLANLLSAQLPGYQVASEVTGGSIDNLKLVAALAAGSTGVLSVAATCASAGIIVGVVTLTGLA
jgi:TRAP-type uncharacterized transport system substrate-binding protein